MTFNTFTRACALVLAATAANHAFAQETDTAAIRMAATEAGDAEAGLKVFKKCKACHQVGEGAKKRVGPVLTNVVGSEIGSSEGFKYSKSLLAKKEEGGVWDIASLQAFLEKPKDFIPKTKMSFKGLSKEDDRNNVIAYLASVADQ